MSNRLPILIVVLILGFSAGPALAEGRNFILWDQAIASSINQRLADEGRCGASPEAVYGSRCRARLNLGFERPVNYFTFIDRVALFAYKYHQIKYTQSIWDNAKLKVAVNLKNIYKQEARAGIELRIRFSSDGPRFEMPGTSHLQPPISAGG
jgi:hypothetical protein